MRVQRCVIGIEVINKLAATGVEIPYFVFHRPEMIGGINFLSEFGIGTAGPGLVSVLNP